MSCVAKIAKVSEVRNAVAWTNACVWGSSLMAAGWREPQEL